VSHVKQLIGIGDARRNTRTSRHGPTPSRETPLLSIREGSRSSRARLHLSKTAIRTTHSELANHISFPFFSLFLMLGRHLIPPSSISFPPHSQLDPYDSTKLRLHTKARHTPRRHRFYPHTQGICFLHDGPIGVQLAHNLVWAWVYRHLDTPLARTALGRVFICR
jgi:hypothetical protein